MNTFHAFGRGATALAALTFVTLAGNAQAQGSIVSYFNFNGLTNGSAVNVATIAPNIGNGSLATTFNSAGVTAFGGTTLNANGSDVAGQALGLNGGGSASFNNGGFLIYSVDTTGFTDLMLSFATQKTATGFSNDGLSVSSDGGTNYVSVYTAFAPSASFAPKTVDLSSFTALNDNPIVKIRFSFDGNTSASGNNRIDNLKLTATAPAPSSALIALIGAVPGALLLRRRK